MLDSQVFLFCLQELLSDSCFGVGWSYMDCYVNECVYQGTLRTLECILADYYP